MQEFFVNKYLSLRLEEERTIIYVGKMRFLQCKFLLLNIPVDEIQFLEDLESIDEAAETLDNSQEYFDLKKVEIPPETAFWGHCSNLQTWFENNYDTRLLHRNLAFPLLKKLTEAGDPQARQVFKEEIAIRFLSSIPIVMVFLLEQKYLDFLDSEEIDLLLRSVKEKDPQIYRYLLPILMEHEYIYQDYQDVEIERLLIKFYQDPEKGLFDGMILEDYLWWLRRETILELQAKQRKKKKKRIRYNRSYQG